MAVHCYIPFLGKRIRVTTLDDCGNPPAAGTENAQLSTDGFITLTLSAEVESGSEIITKKASGALCVNERMADSFKRFTIEMEFCGVNPALLSMVTNAEPYEDYAGDVAGFTVPEGEINKKFALELWTGLSGQACVPGADQASGYLLLPFVTAGVMGDITVDGENAVTFSLTGAFTKGQNNWGVGPYDVLMDDSGSPAPLPEALDPMDHLLMIDTALAPPPDACDPSPMPTPGEVTATSGAPGTIVPTTPPSLADGGLTMVASPTTAWSEGEYVVLGDGTEVYWGGESWAEGRAPAAVQVFSSTRRRKKTTQPTLDEAATDEA